MDDFEQIVKNQRNITDMKALAAQMKADESALNRKRRWMTDLPLSTGEQKRLEEMLPGNDKILPESILREDDISYEDMKTCIETAFGAHNNGNKSHYVRKNFSVPDSNDAFRDILFLLDNMTNKGLYCFTKILTNGTIEFEKTSSGMWRTVKELLPKVISDKSDISRAKLRQLLQVLQDAETYRGNRMVHSYSPEDYRAAAVKVLDEIKDFPTDALNAMYRKLKGVEGYIPSMTPSRSGLSIDKLINVIKKNCMEMLADLSEMVEPSEGLSGALGVASLTLKFIMNRPAVENFRNFSPAIKALHSDIAKAIHLLSDSKRLSLIEVRKVQHLVDPTSYLSDKNLRFAVRKLLTEYLFECSDMDEIPGFVVEVVDVINRRSMVRSCNSRKKPSSEIRKSPEEFMKEAIQKELEIVLAVSAQAKEVVMGLHLEHEFDQDFDRAYMEDYDGYYNSIFDEDEQERDVYPNCEFHSYSLNGGKESFGETNPGESDSPVSTGERDYSDSIEVTAKHLSPARESIRNELKSERGTSCSEFAEEEKTIVCQQRNLYLDVQEACDDATMVAYRFVGRLLYEFAEIEGLELHESDRLYLRNYSSVPEDSQASESSYTEVTSKFPEMWRKLHER